MGMSEELYHRVMAAIHCLDEFQQGFPSAMYIDTQDLIDDFCAWWETDESV